MLFLNNVTRLGIVPPLSYAPHPPQVIADTLACRMPANTAANMIEVLLELHNGPHRVTGMTTKMLSDICARVGLIVAEKVRAEGEVACFCK